MGFKTRWYILTVILFLSFFLSSSLGQSLNNFSADSLDALIQNYAFKALLDHNPHTGALYNAALPANLSGVEVSVVRLKSGSLWIRGANLSVFRIPPRVLTIPYEKRLAIVYQNLGNLSSQYYNVPGYSMVTPVVGFMAYNASNLDTINGITKLNLSVTGDPISIHFPLPEESTNSSLQCVRFNAGGSMDFSEMKLPNVCLTRDQGHFSVVVRSATPKGVLKGKDRLWMFLVIGFVLGIVGLILVGLVGFVVVKIVKMKRIGEMEREADEGEAFETIWVGSSRMPSAKIIRTTPMIENSEAAP
ncbi:Protein of unknown function DUF1191 [Macleaya cordata]|uniref:Legume lectin domain n=1 Tax=Macleaya cordata TaxID=56857 RepID=A0A200PUL9_MACCD|nr:Protein of unknown function DUF1191 [Macleaya cordata]